MSNDEIVTPGLRIIVTDFFPLGNEPTFPFLKYLIDTYGAKEVAIGDKPNLHITSYFGRMKHGVWALYPDIFTIFVSTENLLLYERVRMEMDFKKVDVLLTTNYVDLPGVDLYLGPKTEQFYLPYGAYHYDIVKHWNQRRRPLHEDESLLNEHIARKKRFCAFVASHAIYGEGATYRDYMLNWLKSYKRVDCGGKYRNNMFGHLAPKEGFLDWISQYKFMLCFENSVGYGYVTEKIIQVYLAGTIPIYWGDKDTTLQLFNPKAMIFVTNYEEALEKVKELDNDPIKYREMLNEPLFLIDPNDPISPFNHAGLFQLLDKVVDSILT